MSRILYNIADSDTIETETAMDVQKVAFFLHDYLCLAKWKEDDNCLTVICESNNTARFKPDEFIKDFKATMEDPEVNVMEQSPLYAAVDLGSNSFHLLIVRKVAGQVRIVSRVKRRRFSSSPP